MKKRIMVILISGFVAGIGLFGGWKFYQSYALQKPLDEKVQAVDGVSDVSVERNAVELIISFRPDTGVNLPEIINQFIEITQPYREDQALRFELIQDKSQQLEQWWSLVLFDVAEAMENRTYGAIPEVLETRKDDLPGLQVRAEIDDVYVYIYLERSEESKYILLPRHPIVLKGGPYHG